MEQRALFLDRDGAIHRDSGYVFRKDQVQFVDGIFSLCLTARRLGYRLVVVSYQKGLARGVYTEAEYSLLMRWMQQEFRREGIAFDGIYSCPSGSRQPAVRPIDRKNWKPGAGMLHRAAQNLHLSLTASVMVGARNIDVAIANAGGLSHIFLLRESDEETRYGAGTAVNSLGQVEAWLVSHGKGANLPPASQDLAVA